MRHINLNVPSKPTNNVDQIRICCPFCSESGKTPDTKYHLYVNLVEKIYNCFRCGAGGVLEGYTKNYREVLVTPGIEDVKQKAKKLFSIRDTVVIDLEYISWKISENQTPVAYQYLVNRGFTDDMMNMYNIRVGKSYWDKNKKDYENKWGGRIIFPLFENGKCIYIIGRSYVNKEPKYINSEGMKGKLVFGIENINNDRIGVICEGIISSIAVRKYTNIPAVATLGKILSDYQVSIIRKVCDEVILSYDGDLSNEEIRKSANKLIKYGLKTWLVSLPEGSDPDDLGEKYINYFNNRKRILIGMKGDNYKL
jgi:DNA primase